MKAIQAPVDRLINFAIFSIGLQRFGFGTYIAFIYIDLSTKACITHLPQLSINNVTAHLKDVRPTMILISQRHGNTVATKVGRMIRTE